MPLLGPRNPLRTAHWVAGAGGELARKPRSSWHSEAVPEVLRVGVDDWVVGCCLDPPSVGQKVEWLLRFHKRGTGWYGDAESTEQLHVDATELPDWEGLTNGRRPLLLRTSGGASLYYETTSRTVGGLRLSGSISIAQHGEAPDSFPVVHGLVERVRMAHTMYEQRPAGSRSWEPALPADVLYEELQAAPKWFPSYDGVAERARFSNSVLVDLAVRRN